MAIVALILWMFTAGAGISLLVRSTLGHTRPAGVPPEREQLRAAPVPATAPANAASSATAATPASPATAATPASPGAASPDAAAPAPGATPPSPARSRFDPPSLVASRSAPAIPGARALLEFLHPACAIVGLGFWLGFTLVHARLLGWIAFGLIVVTACLGLGWFTAGRRAAQRALRPEHDGADAAMAVLSFNGRLAAVHGGAAALTLILAAVSVLILKS